MPNAYENWLGPVKSYVCYSHQTREILMVLHFSVNLEVPGQLWAFKSTV